MQIDDAYVRGVAPRSGGCSSERVLCVGFEQKRMGGGHPSQGYNCQEESERKEKRARLAGGHLREHSVREGLHRR